MSTRNATRFNREIGERLKHMRNILGMSREVVADQLGVTRQTLWNYVSGRVSMSAGLALLRGCAHEPIRAEMRPCFA